MEKELAWADFSCQPYSVLPGLFLPLAIFFLPNCRAIWCFVVPPPQSPQSAHEHAHEHTHTHSHTRTAVGTSPPFIFCLLSCKLLAMVIRLSRLNPRCLATSKSYKGEPRLPTDDSLVNRSKDSG